MRFSCNNIELYITTVALKTMHKYKQLKITSKESGGVLLGQVVGDKFYITRVSVPNKYDKQSRYSFHRDKDIAQIICDYEFLNSQGKTVYLGEWHTHPEAIPKPSEKDKEMIAEQFHLGRNLKQFVFLVIQGQKELFVGIYDGEKFCVMK